jgi:toxin secretion/phage lysis holin
MNNTQIKAIFTAIFSLISSMLGVLAIPVILMVLCNVIDYITGLMASTYRSQDINSYKSIKGIKKKVAMWLLVVVGAIIDQLVIYATETAGITVKFTFLVACVVAIWIICNEIISILENIKDMGVCLPGFLQPLVENIKSQVEDKTTIKDTDENDSEGE